MKLGDVLKQERARRRWSTARMASLLEISETEYLDLEAGRRPQTKVWKAVGALGVRYQELDDYP